MFYLRIALVLDALGCVPRRRLHFYHSALGMAISPKPFSVLAVAQS
jgi:hypothetical protein